MIKNRSFWLALLIPLLLGLLFFFIAIPASPGDCQTLPGQETEELLENLCECGESFEEEEEFSSYGMLCASSIQVVSPVFHAWNHFPPSMCRASSLACGWMMPLRI